MAEEKTMRLSLVAKQINVGTSTILQFLSAKGHKVDNNPNAKLNFEQLTLLAKEYGANHLLEDSEPAKKPIEEPAAPVAAPAPVAVVAPAPEPVVEKIPEPVAVVAPVAAVVVPEPVVEKPVVEAPAPEKEEEKQIGLKVLGRIELDKKGNPVAPKPAPKSAEVPKAPVVPAPEPVKVEAPAPAPVVPAAPVVEEIELIEAKGDTLKGLTVLGKIELPVDNDRSGGHKHKRKRIIKEEKKPVANEQRPAPAGGGANKGKDFGKKLVPGAKAPSKEELSDKDIQEQIKATMARLQGATTKQSFGADKRREKRKGRAEAEEARLMAEDEEAKILKVTEFISASDLASLMDVSVNEVISTCMSLGMFVSINQRLDAEAITVIADEFGFEVSFMGHVDHGKTSLLDYIRRAKVAAGEAGGITQHIGAYSVQTDSGKKVTFLDTPGHEAFTAMRARGAKITDIVIIVIAADDSVMPQTKEAINHAMVAGVPIVFAFSKVDKDGANADKVREELAGLNMLVEDWGGKYQSQEISSKSGLGINDLLEKVLLEAEMLELTANPNKKAVGAVIEAELDKGRGYVTTLLIQAGTLKIGDMMLAGDNYGRVKAMFDHHGQKIKKAGPSTPVQVLGLNGAPQAGDKLLCLENEREAREIANKREQILREQTLRTRKHITLEEIGRRKAIGTFRELNVIVKGDVDGSVEALSDSLMKLSTEEVQVRIIHKGVGQVSESDVALASTSDAVIIAFQVRPSANARRLADTEQIEIRNYSIIYQAIDEIKAAMEGMLAPTFEEVITANIEVRDVFKISKIGTVAGSYVLDGTAKRSNKIRVIRDFVVIHDGEISALKRFKDDVAEVKFGYECGLSVKNFNDLEVGDLLECYEMKEVKRTLK
jgi:translation initiation factor IF-2